VLVDLGAGDGRVCVQACLAHGATAWGVEIDAEEMAKFRANVAAFDLAGNASGNVYLCTCVRIHCRGRDEQGRLFSSRWRRRQQKPK
jgi:predicted RNA methylase